MEKDFDRWNEKKKAVHGREIHRDFFYHEREVWWCAIGANVGVETDGKHNHFERPVLVVRKFNKEMFWGVPLTSHERFGEYFETVAHEAGISWAMLSQFKTLSSKRLMRKIGMISEKDLKKIQDKIQNLIKIEPPRQSEGSRRPKPLITPY